MKSDFKKELNSKAGTGKITAKINSVQFPGTGRCPQKEPLSRGRRIRFENRSFPREQSLPFISAGVLTHTVP